MPHARRAFTLIELLVVIAIIAILAAILFPVFSQAKEAAKKTAALSQMKQLAISVHLYASDEDDTFVPCTNYGASQDSPSRIWTVPLFPYVKDRNLFIAPGSNTAKYADSWATRHQQSIGMSGVTSIDPEGCPEGDLVTAGCEGWASAATMGQMGEPARVGLFAVTPDGLPGTKYRGYSFSPDNGTAKPMASLEAAKPLAADIDLVVDPNYSSFAPSQLKPIFARYGKTGRGEGVTPVIFGDGHAKAYSANAIRSGGSKIVWRFR